MADLRVIKAEECGPGSERSGPGARTAARLITHQIPLLGEQGVAHVDFDIVDIPVPSLLTAETLLIEDILHLRGWRGEAKEISGHGRS